MGTEFQFGFTPDEILEFQFAFSPHSIPRNSKFFSRHEENFITNDTKSTENEKCDLEAYENKRLQNIKERNQKLEALKLRFNHKHLSKSQRLSDDKITVNVNVEPVNVVDKVDHQEAILGATKKKPGRPTKTKSKGQGDVGSNQDYESLTDDDLICPICLEMITKPIRLQCNHLLCRGCFEKLVELTTMHQRKCPKCRRWIGGSRRISEMLDTNLQEFILKKSKGIKKTIKTDRHLAFNILREERRQRYCFRKSTKSKPEMK